MKSKAIVSAIMAISLATGGFAFAQGNSDRNDRGRSEQAQRGDQQDRRDNEARQPNRRDNRGPANAQRDQTG